MPFGCVRDLEADAGRTVELGDDDALGAVDDERAALGHHRDFAHVDFLVLDEVFLAEAELHVERHGVGGAFAEALELGALGLADRVGDVLERQALVVGLDREDLAEHGLEALAACAASRAMSFWRNSRYELIWISMRFGGWMTSRSLPKLMRSE